LVVLSIGYLVATLTGSASQVLLALNRYKVIALLSLAEATVNLGLSILLARHIGIVGVALGTTIPLTVMAFGVLLPFACRLVGLPYSLLLRRLALPAAVNATAYGILRLVAGSPRLFSNLIVLIVACVIVFAVCFSASFLLDPSERSTYKDMLRQLALRERSS
jgi:O-antigen/teichoic acid export membrane protein